MESRIVLANKDSIMEKCFFCQSQMVKVGTRTEIQNGAVRQLTEYKCPNCGNSKVLDRPYE